MIYLGSCETVIDGTADVASAVGGGASSTTVSKTASLTTAPINTKEELGTVAKL